MRNFNGLDRYYQEHPATTKFVKPKPRAALPALASAVYDLDPFGWGSASSSSLMRTVLCGVHDPDSPLCLLLGKEDTLVQHIFEFVTSKWADHVLFMRPCRDWHGTSLADADRNHQDPVHLRNFLRQQVYCEFPRNRQFRERLQVKQAEDLEDLPNLNDKSAFVSVKVLKEFPEPRDINISMMPFRFGDPKSLGEKYEHYHPLIQECPYMKDEIGKVGYLTIQESHVDGAQSQRRQGLHIEAPRICSDEDNDYRMCSSGRFTWGGGWHSHDTRLEGGIFMASSVADTSQVWNTWVDKSAPGIVDHDGGCEHLRPLVGLGHKLRARELIWMTDSTPHEVLPQRHTGYRQFFRIVTSNISHWYADHSTPNPLVPLPDHVVIVHGNKFESGGTSVSL